jgi:hypothetical protein
VGDRRQELVFIGEMLLLLLLWGVLGKDWAISLAGAGVHR